MYQLCIIPISAIQYHRCSRKLGQQKYLAIHTLQISTSRPTMARRVLGLLLLAGGLRNYRLVVYQSIEPSHFTGNMDIVLSYETLIGFVFWCMQAVVEKCFLKNPDDLFEQCLFNTRTNSCLECSYLMCTSCTTFSRPGTFIGACPVIGFRYVLAIPILI